MPISDILAQIAGEKQSSVSLPNSVPKRKADGDLQRITDKSVRRDQPAANTTTAMRQTTKPANIQPIPAHSRSSIATSSNARSNSSASNGNRGTSTPAPANQPAKEPKKGSYAEILARAKAAQATLSMVGKIQHKAIEKSLSKRERQELKKDQASKSYRISKRALPSGVRTNAGDGRSGTREKSGKVPSKVKASQTPEKKVKKAALATTGYTGTARPNPALVKFSKSTTPSRTAEKSGHGRSSGRQNTYASEDEDEDEDEDVEEDDEDDYGSDISSDMEADVFEVDEEEEKAARIARREDEEALREEVRHQREKEEKRRRLANMAKGRR